VCGEAGGTGNFPIEQRLDIGHGGSRPGPRSASGSYNLSPLALRPARRADMLPVISRLRRNTSLGATAQPADRGFRTHNL